ncbi:MAG: hypothetical protein LBL74_07510 [Bacteroidales bacterium]|jgi:hypothetical protein|nr:hypothetical protein [Bacteroidales bacterium]
MKKLMLLMSLLCIGFISCEDKADESTKQSELNNCSFDNPLTDLIWLKDLINLYEQDTLTSVAMNIYQCTYHNDKTGFLIEYCAGCPDAGITLTDCAGNGLCLEGGVASSTCGEYNIDWYNAVLIYQHNN